MMGPTANGVELDTYGIITTDSSGLYVPPARRGGDLEVPGRHGAVRVRQREYGPGTVVLQMTVGGCLPDGSVPPWSSEQQEMLARLDELLDVFRADEIDLRWPRPDGSVRRVVGSVKDVMDFTRVGAGTAGRVAVSLLVPDAFWFDVDPVTSSVTVTASGGVAKLWEFDGAGAPMSDLDITVGPAWNPVLTDLGSGCWIAYDGIIGPGEALRIDCANRRVYGGGGLFVDQALIRRGGARGRLFELSPGRPPSVVVESTGLDPVSLQVSGRRAFLTA